MGILEKLFIVLILFFPLGEITRFYIGKGIAVSLNDLIVLLVFSLWIIISFWQKKRPNYKFKKIVIIFSVVGLFSLILNRTLNSEEFLISSSYLLRWVMYSGLYFVISGFSLVSKKRILNVLFFSSILMILGGYVQYFFYPDLRNLYYLGWDEHLYRMFSSFLDPNFAGTIFVLYFILTGGMLLHSILEKNRKKMFIFGAIGLITLPAIFLTYSRSALIMFIVSVCVFLIISGKKKIIAGLAIIVFLIIFILPKTFQTEGTNFLRTASVEARFDSSQTALVIFKNNPIFGVGFNAYRYAQTKGGFAAKNDESHALAGTDNSFLFVLATTGIVGLASYLFLWKEIFKIANIKSKNKYQKSLSIVLISSTIGLFVGALFINSLFYPFIMEWMWILIGATENK